MAHVVLMPKAGQSMIEGRVVAWLKKEGERVERGEPLLEIETDKANLEVEALEGGVLRKVFVGEGEVCPVLAPVGVLGTKDEEIDFDALRRAAEAEAGAAGDGGEMARGAGAPAAEEPAAPGAQQAATPPDSDLGTAREPAAGRGPVKDLPEATRSSPPRTSAPSAAERRGGESRRVLASPVARRIAGERGIDLRAIRGSGPGGRILRSDVEHAPAATQGNGGMLHAALPRAAAPPPPAPRPPARVALEGMRKAIASALIGSKRSIPHFYATATIDVTTALALRESRVTGGRKPSVNDLIVRAATLALRDEPRMSCRVFDEHIDYPEDINIGIAVGTDDGLVVPVLVRAQALDLEAIADRSRKLVASAREGKLTGAGQGTFTISNLGMYGIDGFTAIINPPEGAILAVGSVRQALVPAGGGFFPRSILQVTLSCDHRAIDGVIAARFLARLRAFLEEATEL